jgi:steroid delta-isomerase-like uncharacterized protein
MGTSDRRERIVKEHVAAEEAGDWAAALATFGRARYEIMPTGEVYDGAEDVMRLYSETAAAFPRIQFETRAFYAAGEAILHEATFSATHAGTWRGLPATDRTVRYAMLNVFEFDGDALVCERMYFDLLTPLRQIGVARDPTSLGGRIAMAANHPLTVGRAFLRGAVRA